MRQLIRILVLSHDRHFVELLLQELKHCEIQCTELITHTHAAYTQALQAEKPDIIVADDTLPHTDAISAFNVKQELLPYIPFLVVSETIGEQNAVELIKMGVSDYVKKENIRLVCFKLQRALAEAHERRRLNREKQEQQALINSILGTIPNGFFALAPNQVVIHWNHMAEQMLKVPREKILGKNLWDVFGRFVPAKFTAAYHEVIARQSSVTLEDYLPLSNSWYEVKMSYATNAVVVFMRDITAKKRKEKLLLLEKEMLELYTVHKNSFSEAITHLLNGIKGLYPAMSFVLSRVEEDRLYNWVSPHLSFATEDAEQGVSIQTAQLPQARAAAQKQVVYVRDISLEEVWEEYAREVTAQGMHALVCYPLFDVNQQVIGVLTVFFEKSRPIGQGEEKAVLQAISVLRQLVGLQSVQHAIRKSEQKYRILFHASPTPMWVYDSETFRFLDVNAAAIQHYGYSEQEFKSMTLFDIRPKEDHQALAAALSLSDEPGINPHSPFRHLTKSGKIIWVDVQSNSFDLKGRKARVVQATDVTETLKHTQEMEAQNAMLREIAWMQSHVVRAPVARIMGLASLLSKSSQATSLDRVVVRHMLESTKELDTVIRSIVEKAEKLEIYKEADAPSLPIT